MLILIERKLQKLYEYWTKLTSEQGSLAEIKKGIYEALKKVNSPRKPVIINIHMR